MVSICTAAAAVYSNVRPDFCFLKPTHTVNWAIHLGMWLHQIHQMAHCMNTQAHFSSLRKTAILLGQKSKRYYFFAARNFCSTHTDGSLGIVYHICTQQTCFHPIKMASQCNNGHGLQMAFGSHAQESRHWSISLLTVCALATKAYSGLKSLLSRKRSEILFGL